MVKEAEAMAHVERIEWVSSITVRVKGIAESKEAVHNEEKYSDCQRLIVFC